LSDISEATGASPSVVLSTLRWMVAHRKIDRIINHDKTRVEFLTIEKPDDVEDIVFHAPAVKKPVEPPLKKDPVCKHGVNLRVACDECAVPVAINETKPKESVMVADNPNIPIPTAPKLDRRSAEFKAEKRKLIRAHVVIPELSAELQADGTVKLYEILPDIGKTNGVTINQEMSIPVECINDLCEALQSLRQLHKRTQG
jgi:hypothetical protein